MCQSYWMTYVLVTRPALFPVNIITPPPRRRREHTVTPVGFNPPPYTLPSFVVCPARCDRTKLY